MAVIADIERERLQRWRTYGLADDLRTALHGALAELDAAVDLES